MKRNDIIKKKKKEKKPLTTSLISPEVAEKILIKFGGKLPKHIIKKKKK